MNKDNRDNPKQHKISVNQCKLVVLKDSNREFARKSETAETGLLIICIKNRK